MISDKVLCKTLGHNRSFFAHFKAAGNGRSDVELGNFVLNMRKIKLLHNDALCFWMSADEYSQGGNEMDNRRVSAGKNVRVRQIPVRVKPKVQIPVTAKKTTFTRKNLPDGDFMMNYYFIRDKKGNLIPADIEEATHYERVVYDRDGNVIGSTIGELTDSIRW